MGEREGGGMRDKREKEGERDWGREREERERERERVHHTPELVEVTD